MSVQIVFATETGGHRVGKGRPRILVNAIYDGRIVGRLSRPTICIEDVARLQESANAAVSLHESTRQRLLSERDAAIKAYDEFLTTRPKVSKE